MATLSNYNQQDDDTEDAQKAPSEQPSVTGMGGGSGQAAQTAPGGGQGPIMGGAKGPTSSGRFTNIQKYLGANRGNMLGQQLQAKTGERVEKTKQNIGQAAQTFGQQAQANTVRDTDNTIGRAVENATEWANDPTKLQQFTALRTAQYGGPQSLQDLQGQQNLAALQAQNQRVQDIAKSAGTEAGQGVLLRQMFARPTYTGGQQRLDQLLLGRTAGVNQGLRQQASGVQSSLTEAQANALSQARQAEDTTRLTREAAVNALNQAVGSEQDKTGLLGQLAERMASQKSQSEKIKDLFAKENTGRFDEDFYNKYKLEQKLGDLVGKETYGTNISPFFHGADINRIQDVASQADVDRYQALKQLSGLQKGEDRYLTQAGKYVNPEDLVEVDKEKLMSEIEKAHQGFEKEYARRAAEGDRLSSRVSEEERQYLWGLQTPLQEARTRLAQAAYNPTINVAQEQQKIADLEAKINAYKGPDASNYATGGDFSHMGETLSDLSDRRAQAQADAQNYYKLYRDPNTQYRIGKKLQEILNNNAS